MSVAAMVMFSISIYLVPVLPLHQQYFFFADFAFSLRIRNRHEWKQSRITSITIAFTKHGTYISALVYNIVVIPVIEVENFAIVSRPTPIQLLEHTNNNFIKEQNETDAQYPLERRENEIIQILLISILKVMEREGNLLALDLLQNRQNNLDDYDVDDDNDQK